MLISNVADNRELWKQFPSHFGSFSKHISEESSISILVQMCFSCCFL